MKKNIYLDLTSQFKRFISLFTGMNSEDYIFKKDSVLCSPDSGQYETKILGNTNLEISSKSDCEKERKLKVNSQINLECNIKRNVSASVKDGMYMGLKRFWKDTEIHGDLKEEASQTFSNNINSSGHTSYWSAMSVPSTSFAEINNIYETGSSTVSKEKCIKFLQVHDFEKQAKYSGSSAFLHPKHRIEQMSLQNTKLLSPRNSLGSTSSHRSSNSDSAVDLLTPEEDLSELFKEDRHSHFVAFEKSNLLTIFNENENSKFIRREFSPPSVIVSDYSTSYPDPWESNIETISKDAPDTENEALVFQDQLKMISRKFSSGSFTSDVSEISLSSLCSESSYSLDEKDDDGMNLDESKNQWKKIKSIIHWTPFVQRFKKLKYPWIQLAGHKGHFQAGESGTIMKKFNLKEQKCFEKLMNDKLKYHIPEYKGVIERDGEKLQDLLCEFTRPSVMDVKMGVRTYLEEELQKARENPKLRQDMYLKMVEIDPSAPTQEEHAQRAVTKPCYMQWRESISSSLNLGFRIEGVMRSDGMSSKEFKTTRTREQIISALKSFTESTKTVVSMYLSKLREIQCSLEESIFFKAHETVGSSLLFIHDDTNTGVWLIDFGKTTPLPQGISVTHTAPWVEGNHEDGYLFGLNNLISVYEELLSQV